MNTATSLTVTRAERKGRWIYYVDGIEVTSRNKAVDYATVGTGNKYREDGVYLTLHGTAAAAAKTAAKFPGMRPVQITAS